jgi:uncharacterized surface protein with fasciclin (FAS1) repeats
MKFGRLKQMLDFNNCSNKENHMRKLLGLLAFVALVIPALADDKKDIVDTATGTENYKTFVSAVKAAGLVDTLKGEGPLTVLIPTDEAFAKLPEGTLDNLLKPENKEKLVAILKYHVIPGKSLAADVLKLDGQEVKTVEGNSAKVAVKDGNVTIDGAKVIKTDIECSNGVIHEIDTVILPPSAK